MDLILKNIGDLKAHRRFVLLDCISGSRAYGLSTPQSDTDLRGVFYLPLHQLYGLHFTGQLNNQSQDEIFYELKRFFQLLLLNNPNILELLNSPEDCIQFKHPVMKLIEPEMFLSRKCRFTFAGYAQSQIQKARGLNKKIVNPVEKERKSVLDFCYVIKGQGAISLEKWLGENNFRQEDCGLISLPHMCDMYAMVHRSQLPEGFVKGIVSGPEANDVSLSSVPEGVMPLAVMSFNKDGYSQYCRSYREYWDWVEKRNEARYESTLEHGKNYDAKNMMHTFRLLNMAEEIALYKEVRVRRTDRDFLLAIRKGEYEYDDLVRMAEEKTNRIQELFEQSDLPEEPDELKCNALLVEMREQLYKK